MKNKFMLLVVVAGVLTATYRFLPVDEQAKVNNQLQKVAQLKEWVPAAEANAPQQKYLLDIPDSRTGDHSASSALNAADAFMQHQEGVQVRDHGEVLKILNDDNKGSRHQRFIIRTDTGVSLLIAHNIDIAPRINSLSVGDALSFYGEYEWNEKGGVLHWTHRDPRGHHVPGWIKHEGVIYQ